jgi:hypothetical protein
MAQAPFPNRPFALRDQLALIQQDTAGNRSLVRWELWIDKLAYSPTSSGGGKAVRWMRFDQQQVGISQVPGFDFTGNGPWLILGPIDTWWPHNADGTKTIAVQGYGDYDILGATIVNDSITLPAIATYGPPNPTQQGAISNVKKTSLDYTFGYGGGFVQYYEARYATKPDYSDAVVVPGNNGLVPLTNLKQGTPYWVQSRAVNDKGASAWAAEATARTLSGAYISDGTAWLAADVLISDGTKWVPADVLISDGTKWVPAG